MTVHITLPFFVPLVYPYLQNFIIGYFWINLRTVDISVCPIILLILSIGIPAESRSCSGTNDGSCDSWGSAWFPAQNPFYGFQKLNLILKLWGAEKWLGIICSIVKRQDLDPPQGVMNKCLYIRFSSFGPDIPPMPSAVGPICDAVKVMRIYEGKSGSWKRKLAEPILDVRMA